jgi:WD40 repeat protein
VIDLVRQQTILSLPGAHNGRVVHLRWSRNGHDLISWGLDGILACREFGPSPTNEIASGAAGAPFVASADGKWLATAHDDEERIRLLGRQTGIIAYDFDSAGLQAVKHLAFGPDNRSLAAADGYSVVAWDLTTGGEIARLDNAAGLRGLLTSVAFTSQGACLASENTGNSTVSVWNVLEKRIVCSIAVNQNVATTMFCSEASRLAIICGGGPRRFDRLFVFESLTGRRIADRELTGSLLGSAACSPDGSWLAVLTRSGANPLDEFTKHQLGLPPSTLDVVVEPFLEGGLGQTITGPSAPGERACVFSPDGRLVALGYRDGSISLWDLISREEVFHVRYRSLPITQLAFGESGRLLLAGDAGRTIGTIDLAQLRQDLAPLRLAW